MNVWRYTTIQNDAEDHTDTHTHTYAVRERGQHQTNNILAHEIQIASFK